MTRSANPTSTTLAATQDEAFRNELLANLTAPIFGALTAEVSVPELLIPTLMDLGLQLDKLKDDTALATQSAIIKVGRQIWNILIDPQVESRKTRAAEVSLKLHSKEGEWAILPDQHRNHFIHAANLIAQNPAEPPHEAFATANTLVTAAEQTSFQLTLGVAIARNDIRVLMELVTVPSRAQALPEYAKLKTAQKDFEIACGGALSTSDSAGLVGTLQTATDLYVRALTDIIGKCERLYSDLRQEFRDSVGEDLSVARQRLKEHVGTPSDSGRKRSKGLTPDEVLGHYRKSASNALHKAVHRSSHTVRPLAVDAPMRAPDLTPRSIEQAIRWSVALQDLEPQDSLSSNAQTSLDVGAELSRLCALASSAPIEARTRALIAVWRDPGARGIGDTLISTTASLLGLEGRDVSAHLAPFLDPSVAAATPAEVSDRSPELAALLSDDGVRARLLRESVLSKPYTDGETTAQVPPSAERDPRALHEIETDTLVRFYADALISRSEVEGDGRAGLAGDELHEIAQQLQTRPLEERLHAISELWRSPGSNARTPALRSLLCAVTGDTLEIDPAIVRLAVDFERLQGAYVEKLELERAIKQYDDGQVASTDHRSSLHIDHYNLLREIHGLEEATKCDIARCAAREDRSQQFDAIERVSTSIPSFPSEESLFYLREFVEEAKLEVDRLEAERTARETQLGQSARRVYAALRRIGVSQDRLPQPETLHEVRLTEERVNTAVAAIAHKLRNDAYLPYAHAHQLACRIVSRAPLQITDPVMFPLLRDTKVTALLALVAPSQRRLLRVPELAIARSKELMNRIEQGECDALIAAGARDVRSETLKILNSNSSERIAGA